MGSGQGKTRRALVSTAAPQNTTKTNNNASEMKPERWAEFVENSGIQNVKLTRYYLNKDNTDLTSTDYEQIMPELLTDMITAGAVTLPDTYTSEDFLFKVTGGRALASGHYYMTVALKNKPDATISMGRAKYCFDNKTTMHQIGKNYGALTKTSGYILDLLREDWRTKTT